MSRCRRVVRHTSTVRQNDRCGVDGSVDGGDSVDKKGTINWVQLYSGHRLNLLNESDSDKRVQGDLKLVCQRKSYPFVSEDSDLVVILSFFPVQCFLRKGCVFPKSANR